MNDTIEYVVWNPKTMEITGTVPMPELAARWNLKLFGSYTDRSTIVRDGLLHLRVVWVLPAVTGK